MSPTGVAVLLLVAFGIDFLSVFPVWLRDRLAFLFGTAAIYEGFNGSLIDSWTLERAEDGISWLLAREFMSAAYIAGAIPAVLLGLFVAVAWVYCLGALLPNKFSKKLGRVATIQFTQSGLFQINARLWILAAVLGLFCDLPRAGIGSVTEGSVDWLCSLVSFVPTWLVGLI